jgi:hypothetical protein
VCGRFSYLFEACVNTVVELIEEMRGEREEINTVLKWGWFWGALDCGLLFPAAEKQTRLLQYNTPASTNVFPKYPFPFQ